MQSISKQPYCCFLCQPKPVAEALQLKSWQKWPYITACCQLLYSTGVNETSNKKTTELWAGAETTRRGESENAGAGISILRKMSIESGSLKHSESICTKNLVFVTSLILKILALGQGSVQACQVLPQQFFHTKLGKQSFLDFSDIDIDWFFRWLK